MIFRQKAMLRTAIRPKRKVVAGRTLGNRVARRGYCGVPVDDFRASFPLSGMTLSVVLGRTPWRAMRESYTDCREYMPLPPFVNPRPAEDVPEAAGGPMQPSASGGCGLPLFGRGRKRIFLTESGCESVGNIPTFREFPARKSLPSFVTKRRRQKCPQGTSVGIGRRFSLSGHARSTPFAHTRSGRSNRRSICSCLRCNAEDVVRFAQR